MSTNLPLALTATALHGIRTRRASRIIRGRNAPRRADTTDQTVEDSGHLLIQSG